MKLSDKKKRSDELLKEIQNLEEKRQALFKEFNSLKEEIVNEEFPKDLTLKFVLTSNYSVFESKKAYEKLNKFMSQFKCVHLSGYNPETGRKTPSICILKRLGKAEQIAEIKRFIPHTGEMVTPRLWDENGRSQLKDFKAKYFGISEPSCAQHGVFSLRIAGSKAYLCKCTYGSNNILKEWDSIDEALEYIAEKFVNNY